VTLLDVLSISSADSFALRNHGMKAMLPRAFPEKAFPSHYVLKDMGYALEMAAETGVTPRMAEQARSYYQNAIDAGVGDAYFPVIVDLVGK
jgi:3-hydroxyisobutyrate dehydrogenase-like beta-hydroxyacid dehydrogenase